ncbi:hypothetical protein AQUCO_07600098v1 [Aquilegia coerulea]|uniref:Cytochrome P450 n=1 Tax=Aquilegia coerulea TaxID=218851 RepID=A0A2G5C8S4_AQUCA|nr:hypothetical protein AQUCO_07600098v1 [Aquilegia coerulea]
MEVLVFITLMVSSSLLLWFALKVFHSLWWKPKSLEKQLKQQGIKGTSYKFLFGDLKDYARLFKEASSKPMNLTHHIAPRVVPFIHETVKTYGKHSLFWYGTMPTLVIVDPEMIKEVFSNKLGDIQKAPDNPNIKTISQGLSTMEGDKWTKQRKLITPAFHLEKLKGMTPAFITSCTDLIERWKKSVAPNGSCEMDVWPDIQTFTGDVISRTAFGSNFEEGKKIFELQKEQTVLVMEALQSLYLPGFRFIPTKKNKRRAILNKEINSQLSELIQRKLLGMNHGELGADDLLDMLLQYSNHSSLHAESSDSNNGKMTIDEVIEECKLFYFAGQETSSNWLTWTMIVLAMNPTWQEKAREEVLQICGKSVPSFENLSHFKIVTMILNEMLRLYPPAVSQYRYTVKTTEIGNISIPAGVQLMLPTLVIHHDQEVWGKDAQEFKPERFSEGISKASNKDEGVTFFPFGWGPRICLAHNFAMIEAKMALAMILQHFSFQLSPLYVHAPHTVITLQPQHGAQIILHGL